MIFISWIAMYVHTIHTRSRTLVWRVPQMKTATWCYSGFQPTTRYATIFYADMWFTGFRRTDTFISRLYILCICILCYRCALSSALFLLLNVSIISAGSATNAMLGTLDRRKAQHTYDAAAALDLHDKPLKFPQEILLCYVQARQSLPS